MIESSITTLVGDVIRKRNWKCYEFVDGNNGFLYGIPFNYNRVVKFNPIDKSLEEIGPNLGYDHSKWMGGVRSNDGNIYCAPRNAYHILKIDTSNDVVETLEDVKLPETGSDLWGSGALASDDAIYYMPDGAHRILKFDPYDGTASSVGNDLGGRRFKYSGGTVLGNDDCLYGIPYNATHIIKYDPAKPYTTFTVGEGTRGELFKCTGGILGSDGNIYSLNTTGGQILKIDTESNSYTWIGDKINFSRGYGWGNPTIGADSSVYWSPVDANRVLKFNVEEQTRSLVGDDLGEGGNKWFGTALSSDGFIYCIPHQAKKFLQIDSRPVNLLHKSMVGGTDDSPKDAIDRLGYYIYAEGICEVARSVENPMSSLCIALFGPWGSGKTFVWELSRSYLESDSDKLKDEIERGMDERPATKLERSIIFTFTTWCRIARTFTFIFCCCGSTLKETELVTIIMILTCPIGLPFCIVAILCQMTILPLLKILCAPLILGFKFCCSCCDTVIEDENGVKSFTCDEYEKSMRNINNNPDIKNGNSHLPHNRSHLITEHDEENLKNKENVMWSDVRNIITGKTDIYATDRSHDKSGTTGSIGALQLLFLATIQRLCKLTKRSLSVFAVEKEYEIDERMTKYIFVEFNAWVYSGTDLLWAKLLEELWTNVEKECGKLSVRLHRASISLSKEKNKDNIDTRRRKRSAAMFKLMTCTGLSIILGSVVAALLVSYAVKNTKILSILSFSPSLYFFSVFGINVIPDLFQSRGAKILRQVRSFETHDRPDFSQKTGFMGEVEREVKYFFDFLRTTYVRDDKIKRRRPIRLALFVDDLDRCPKMTIMKVLEAVILLLVDAPITCWLAIDSRLVVASIEDHFGERFAKGGLDGYQYLEKIVQLPFCIPDLEDSVKENFLLKTLESTELTPLRIYNRIKFLEGENVKDFSNVFTLVLSDTTETEAGAFQALIPVLGMMVSQQYFKNHCNGENRAVRSPEEVFKAVENISYDIQTSTQRRLNDQFLHWISVGIEIVLHRMRKGLPQFSGHEKNENALDGYEREVAIPFNFGNASNSSLYDTTANADDTYKAATDTNSVSTGGYQQVTSKEENFRQVNGYQNLFHPMASPEERDWFIQYAKYFSGKPRKIKRILNSHMVNRYIASKMKPNEPLNSSFYKNLLKFTILLEQWPYRMAWLLLVVENLEQELEIKNTIGADNDENLTSSIGESLTSLTEKVLEKGGLPMNRYGDIPLMKIYYHLVQILMHSPDDSNIHLQRDGDPQVFEQILLDDGDSKLKVKDISLIEEGKGSENNLRPYAFNLQRHMVDKVAAEIENCMLLSRKDGKIEQVHSQKGNFFASYKKKSSFFDIASNEEMREFKVQAHPNTILHQSPARRPPSRRMSLEHFTSRQQR